jgi:hypothetical protein
MVPSTVPTYFDGRALGGSQYFGGRISDVRDVQAEAIARNEADYRECMRMLKLMTDADVAAKIAELPAAPSFFDGDDSPAEQDRKLKLANLVYAVVHFPGDVLAGSGWRTWR